jgi:hypothetical protein
MVSFGIIFIWLPHVTKRKHVLLESRCCLCSIVAKQMSCNRFQALKKNIHVVNNEALLAGGKIAKIRHLIEATNESLKQFGIFEKHLSVDNKQMTPYYGRHNCKIFIRCKPIRFGFKQWMFCSFTGHPFHMNIYTGKTGTSEDAAAPIRSKVVREVLKCISDPRCCVVFMNIILRQKIYKRMSKMHCSQCCVHLHNHCSPLHHESLSSVLSQGFHTGTSNFCKKNCFLSSCYSTSYVLIII